MTLTDSPRAATVAADHSSPLLDVDAAAAGRPVSRVWLVFWAVVIALVYGLLWSRYWYPLSDSSLYLSLARSLASGRGYTYMGGPHRLVPPATPLLIALIMKLGGGIGAIQAVLTALMLVAHLFCFLALRRWVAERLALAATIASALSYWVFINAFTIMSEPLGLSLYWAGVYAITRAAQSPRARWISVLPGVVLLIAAMESRIATLGTVPGILAALWFTTRNRGLPLRTRIAWGLTFCIAFPAAFLAYRHPARLYVALGLAARDDAATQPTLKLELEADSGNVREGTYAAKFLQGVPRNWHLITDPPVLAGRWVCEGLAMPSVVLFTSQTIWVRVVGVVVGLAVATFLVIGCLRLLWLRQWWVLLPLSYFLIPWLQWGARLKPRYVAPIAPMVFIALCLGVQTLAARVARHRPSGAVLSRLAVWMVLAPLLIANAVAWGTEFYVRRVSRLNFYDVARRGAYADLVDIGAYLQANSRGQDAVWMNEAAARRIAYFLSGRRTEVPSTRSRRGVFLAEIPVPAWRNLDGEPGEDETQSRDALRRYFQRIPRGDHWAIVYVAPEAWPDFHLPLRQAPKPASGSYWRLYHRHSNGSFHRVMVPRQDRSYVERVPAAGI